MINQRLSVLAVLLCATSVLAAQAAEPTRPLELDLPGYTAQLQQWSTAIERLGEHPSEAAALRAELPDHFTVTANDQKFEVSTHRLMEPLDRFTLNPQSAPANLRALSWQIESMREEASALADTTNVQSGGAQNKLANILKQREFRGVRDVDESDSWWDQLMDKVFEWLGKFLGRASGHPAVFNFFLWGIVVVFAVMFLVWLFYTLTRATNSQTAATVKTTTPEPAWADLVRQARDAAGRGDYREAIRILFRAAVRRLGETGVWQVDPARTHREYLRLLPPESVYRLPVAAMATRFERVWYGRAAASAHEFEEALAELESLP